MEVTGGNWGHSLGCAIPSLNPHTPPWCAIPSINAHTPPFSSTAASAAALRAQCLNKLIFFFVLSSAQSNLPSPSFSPAAVAQGSLSWVVTLLHACSHAQPQQLSDYQEILQTRAMNCRISAGKALLAHPDTLYAAAIKSRFYFPLWVKQSKSSLPWQAEPALPSNEPEWQGFVPTAVKDLLSSQCVLACPFSPHPCMFSAYNN